MIITCEKCDTSFNLDESLLKPTGSKVRCSKCRAVFTAYPPQPPAEEQAPIPEADPSPETETAVAEETLADLPSEEDEDLAEDLDFNLDAEPAAPAQAGAALAADTSTPAEPPTEADEDLDLGFDLESDAQAPPAVEAEAHETPPEAAIEDGPAPEASPGEAAPASEELDLDLGIDLEPVAETQKPAEAVDLDFDLEAEEAAETPAAEVVDGEDLDLDLDLDFDAEEGPEAPASTADAEQTLELDLEDLGLADTPEAAAASGDVEAAEDLDLDFDLGLEEAAPAGEETRGAAEAETDELDLDLEMDAAAPADEEVEDLDLSDIEEMLSDETLEKDDTLETEKWKTESVAEGEEAATAELDLSDLESALDAVDDTVELDLDETEDLDLDLDLEPLEAADEAVSASPEVEETFELEMEGAQEEEDDTGGLQLEQPFVADDIQLEFEVDESGGGEETEIAPELQADDEDLEEEDELAASPATRLAGKPKKPRRAARRGGFGRSLLVILLLVVLGLAAVVYLDSIGIETPYVSKYVRQIPYVGEFLKPEVKAPVGEIQVIDINSAFVDNAAHGKLLVITGNAVNAYSEPRSFLRVKGKLFSAGKKLVQTQDAYCGNVVSDLDLAGMDLLTIEKRLTNRLGEKQSNVKVAPGKAVPFMVVFADLPDDLEEFTVEPMSSFPAKQ